MTVIADRVSVAIADGVADVRMIRADKMNALDPAMFDALLAAADDLAGRRSVRAVVLSGEGRAFCAGADFNALAAMAGGGAQALLTPGAGGANVVQRAVLVWRDLPVPVIAAVHGVAFGGGFQIMLGADLRFVEPETKLSVMEIRWGIIPDMAGTWLMRGLARDDIVRELTFTGRIFTGKEAKELGLATRLCADPHAEALALAREIATRSPDAVRAAKTLVTSAATNTLADQLRMETEIQAGLVQGRNHAEAVAAGLANRAPKFED